MTPVRVLGLHGEARGSGAVLFVETVARDRVPGFHIPPSEAGRVARLLGLARCRRVPVYDLLDSMAASLGGRVSGAILDAQPDGICARLQLARIRATPTDLRPELPAVAAWLEGVQPSDFAALEREGSG